ncbi:MAG: 2-C-methyl-D-erythritol 4-phosphate cytidylyltransferase [Bacteroidales bacterium]
MEKCVIVVAGGKGLRMGGDIPKQFRFIGGRPVLMHTLEAFCRYDESIGLVVVLPEAHFSYWRELCRQYAFSLPHTVVAGGATRFHSVFNGLQAVPDEVRLIAVHDGVRPFVSCRLVADAFAAAGRFGAAIPVTPVIESLRHIKDDGANEAVPRAEYRSVQTPQVFDSVVFRNAYRQPYRDDFTDDASVVEAAGYRVTLVEGDIDNIKITTPLDLAVAEILCADE